MEKDCKILNSREIRERYSLTRSDQGVNQPVKAALETMLIALALVPVSAGHGGSARGLFYGVLRGKSQPICISGAKAKRSACG
jgi:hypothetical protein